MIVETKRHGDITVVRLNSPERRNAMTPDAANVLHAAFVAFDQDADAKVAVLTGQGPSFCSGADLAAIERGDGWNAGPDGRGSMGPTRLQLSKPVIAAIEGAAVGGGFELAMWCDLRVASTAAVFRLGSRRWGIPCLDGGTFRLQRLVGQSRAMEIVLTGRDVSAQEAYAIGLAHRLVAPGATLEAALVWARQISSLPQAALNSDRACVLAEAGMVESSALIHEAAAGLNLMSSMTRRTHGDAQEAAS